MVLAQWMQTDLTHFHNHEILRTSCSHPRYIHLPCHAIHVIVNNEYVHHPRAAQSIVALCKRDIDPDIAQCRVLS